MLQKNTAPCVILSGVFMLIPQNFSTLLLFTIFRKPSTEVKLCFASYLLCLASCLLSLPLHSNNDYPLQINFKKRSRFLLRELSANPCTQAKLLPRWIRPSGSLSWWSWQLSDNTACSTPGLEKSVLGKRSTIFASKHKSRALITVSMYSSLLLNLSVSKSCTCFGTFTCS